MNEVPIVMYRALDIHAGYSVKSSDEEDRKQKTHFRESRTRHYLKPGKGGGDVEVH